MRLHLISPADLSEEQRPLYEAMRAGIQQKFTSFKTEREDGALIVPFNPWLHQPKVGAAVWQLTTAMSAQSTLPEPCRQIAILVTGAHFHAGYEIYAHVAVAREDGLPDESIATIIAGQRPAGLTQLQAVAYDAAAALCAGGVLPELNYDFAVKAFGEQGAAELIYLVGLYCFVSVTLNGFNVPTPEQRAPSATSASGR